MKKLLSLIMILAVVFQSPGIYANAQPPVNSFEQMIRLYEIWPESFAEEINKYVSAAEHYIIHSPNAEAAELASGRIHNQSTQEEISRYQFFRQYLQGTFRIGLGQNEKSPVFFGLY